MVLCYLVIVECLKVDNQYCSILIRIYGLLIDQLEVKFVLLDVHAEIKQVAVWEANRVAFCVGCH